MRGSILGLVWPFHTRGTYVVRLQPDDDAELAMVVPRETMEDGMAGVFCNAQASEDAPVCQHAIPGVVEEATALKRLERPVYGVCRANQHAFGVFALPRQPTNQRKDE